MPEWARRRSRRVAGPRGSRGHRTSPVAASSTTFCRSAPDAISTTWGAAHLW